jgi:NAD(P)-dependent dehydrogenase (short-subunit alcohol dehydrogenase family)
LRIIVTGASGALGSAVVHLMRARGHRVAAILGRHAPADNEGSFTGGDLADAVVAADVVGRAAAWLGGVDALVHVAGGFRWATLADTDAAAMQAMFAANVETVLAVTKAALPQMADGGAIVTIGAASAQPAGAGFAAYGAAKSAVARLTEVMAAELAPRRIRANGVMPAIIDTPANRADMPDADFATWTTPEAIAEVILFLASEAARAINGAMIPVTHSA